ncbi:Putative antiporter CaxA [Halomicronema hongdechloris C2206]|uniref:Antiporter CaxA n=1 Tax=Halomicronema hongdechloris C2206 TaxID=1641165 RepID=A0A1Z3HT03_9CYAN|nr:calcium/sodium antiporter [Halomicronema hongdechloris]ASC73438.1 Putative antiporter CaxA [Halomicronema hongdechloris C2206]
MTIYAILALLSGGLLLLLGAECLVRGAARLAILIGLSPLVIGLTIVAYGTSAPELAVSIQAALANQGDIALGNVLGSNIFNVLMILGLSAVAMPLTVAQQLIRLDVPILIGVSGLLLLFALDGTLHASDGVILLGGSIVYTLFLVVQSRGEQDCQVQAEYAEAYGRGKPSLRAWVINPLLVVIGGSFLVVGSRLLVRGAVAIAQGLGLSELVIGLTIIAAGTSLPELATSVVASLRGERDIAVGNVIGSNIFNILSVLGAAAVFSWDGIPVAASALRFDLPIVVVVAVACLPIFATGNVISRWEGLLFLGYYVAYSAYLIFRAADYEHIALFSRVMLLFVIPLTLITVVTIAWRWLGRERQPSPPAVESPPSQPQDTPRH